MHVDQHHHPLLVHGGATPGVDLGGGDCCHRDVDTDVLTTHHILNKFLKCWNYSFSRLGPEFILYVEGNPSPFGLDTGVWVELGELVQVGGDESLEGVPHHQNSGSSPQELSSLSTKERRKLFANDGMTLLSPHVIHSEEVYCPGTGGYLIVGLENVGRGFVYLEIFTVHYSVLLIVSKEM